MLLLSIICLFAPFPLWFIEQLLPFPFLIEEIFRFVVVQKTPQKTSWIYPVILGVLFSLSESVLYLINFFQLGNFEYLPLRLILTTSLHTFLFLLLYTVRSNKLLSFIFLIFAIFIHYFYNRYVSLLAF
jgi:hypothetical protein